MAALGVADGVGGAADSAWYSANLMAHAEALSESGLDDPKEIITQAWRLAHSQHALDGRSTMCARGFSGFSADATPIACST